MPPKTTAPSPVAPNPKTPGTAGRGLAWLRKDRAGGVTLTVAALVALLWSNWPGGADYTHLWTGRGPWSELFGLGLDLRAWADQGLLWLFFAVVGLEIRREVTVGELGSVRRAAVPVGAALVGMAVPALVYSAIVAGGPGKGAWGIPMATDVAFALGALGLIGRGTPRSRVFLMTLAVADDIASIAVLVVFYSRGVHIGWLLVGVVATAALGGIWWSRRSAGAVRAGLAAVAWWAMLHAGVDAAVVGVAAGLWGPARSAPSGGLRRGPGPRRWNLRLTPIVNAVVLPTFAVANVGIVLTGSWLDRPGTLRLFFAVVAARIVGKPVGIAVGTLGSRRLVHRGGNDPIRHRALMGIGVVAGIGFTVPLLIIGQALPAGPLRVAATAGLLVGSVLSVLLGAVVLRWPARPATPQFIEPSSPGSAPARPDRPECSGDEDTGRV